MGCLFKEPERVDADAPDDQVSRNQISAERAGVEDLNTTRGGSPVPVLNYPFGSCRLRDQSTKRKQPRTLATWRAALFSIAG